MADISMRYAAVANLEEKASFLQTGFDDFMRDFDTVTGEIMDGWDGKAKTDFAAKCDAVVPAMMAISEMLGKYSNAISQAVYLQQETEAINAASFGMGGNSAPGTSGMGTR